MRRWTVRRHGGPEVLELTTAPADDPAPGHLRVRTVAAGVAFGDVLHRRGAPGSVRPPFVPGYDVVGVIDAVGAEVDGFTVGQLVAGLVLRGGYAESVTCPAHATVPVPAGVDPVDAAAVVLNYLTAYQMLHRVARVTAGDPVLVHGAAGGVGTALLDLARAGGLPATGVATAAKQGVVRDFGARAVDSPAGTGAYRAVFDPVGGWHWLRSYRRLRPDGHLVMYGSADLLTHGALPTLAALAAVTVRAAVSRRRASTYAVAERRSGRNPHLVTDLNHLLVLLSAGGIRPLIADRIPFADAPEAHRRMESRTVTGKLVLTF